MPPAHDVGCRHVHPSAVFPATGAVELTELGSRCRRQSLSMLVAMGQEMNYRYQERLMAELLHSPAAVPRAARWLKLMRLPPDKREFFGWIDREWSHPGWLH